MTLEEVFRELGERMAHAVRESRYGENADFWRAQLEAYMQTHAHLMAILEEQDDS